MASPAASTHVSERLQHSQPGASVAPTMGNFAAYSNHRPPPAPTRDTNAAPPSHQARTADSNDIQQILSAHAVKSLPLELQHAGAAAALMDHANAIAARLNAADWGIQPAAGPQATAAVHAARASRLSDTAAHVAAHSHVQAPPLRGAQPQALRTPRTPPTTDMTDGRMQDAAHRTSGISSAPSPMTKRQRTSHGDPLPDFHTTQRAMPKARSHPMSAPLAVTTARPPRAAIPGVVAPGPASERNASAHAPPAAAADAIPSPWPVLPYLENVEYAIAHAESQPLTFHRTVSRPLADFLSAVMNFLGVQDSSYTGLGAYLTRAFFSDHCAGRLCVYEGLVRYAAASNWHGFLIAALEYIESAGFDTKTLFKITE